MVITANEALIKSLKNNAPLQRVGEEIDFRASHGFHTAIVSVDSSLVPILVALGYMVHVKDTHMEISW